MVLAALKLPQNLVVMNRNRLLAIVVISLNCLCHFTGQTQIYISPLGADTNPGTIQSPKANLSAAIRQVRDLRRLNDAKAQAPIHIILRGGNYFLKETVFIRPEDAGTEKSPTIIEAAPNEHPIISGGVQINGWKKLTQQVAGLSKNTIGKLWVADISKIDIPQFQFRQLWVNNQKAIRAKDLPADSMGRILSWNKQTETCWIPKSSIKGLEHVGGMEMLIHQWWEIAILRIKKMEVVGDSAKLSFYQPESRIQSEHPWPAPWISKKTGNSAFNLVNAIQFINEPGEWFLDVTTQRLYYWPRSGEEITTAEVIAPYLETIINVEGTTDHPVTHLQFKGISFQHSGWLRPSQMGHVPHQTGMYMLDAYKLKIPGTADKQSLENQAWVGRPSAAIALNHVQQTNFEGCRFEHMASTGLDYQKGAQDNLIDGNLFNDIGGNAIMVGVFSDPSVEIHLPYQPTEKRDGCSDITVSNNLINNASNEDWGAVGIAAGHVRSINIHHNEISNVSYSGISMGWGWTKTVGMMQNNRISENYIHHYAKHMYDVAGIYTLSAQPGTVIENNRVDNIYIAKYAHDPNHWFYLYTDEGSSGIQMKNNWTASDKFLQNANGPNNEWINNGPQVSETIKRTAGLLAPYQYLKNEISVTPETSKQKINHALKLTVIEISFSSDKIIANEKEVIEKLSSFCASHGIATNQIYQWKNHWVVYAPIENTFVIHQELFSLFPKAVVKIYRNPLYDFVREKNCQDAVVAKEWDYIILTANLVKDTTMQAAYKEYHASQFKKWPEVAKGFCNASFQQLQVFENDRQLMLVISIPKGKTLDELNPKTTENNPRVSDWNNIMKQYQEGIAGTIPGEVWVFLKPIN